jgi:ubiquinol-cytochrome c reductase cytochrome c1 subunit
MMITCMRALVARSKAGAAALLAGLMVLMSPAAQAAASGVPWDPFPQERITDMAALQRGARLFSNYCLNCHAAVFMRWNRLTEIGLTEEQIKENLIFNGVKVGETMRVWQDPREAKEWFGGVPPDLTLIARSRSAVGKGSDSGVDYLYTFLRTYYRDETKVTGWNNGAFPNVGMPHPLWELQGQQRGVYEEQPDPNDASKKVQVLVGYEPITAGTMTPAQYNEAIADLVAYLKWMAEPVQKDRVRIGVMVLIFLGIFTFIAWRLNAAFWRDIK